MQSSQNMQGKKQREICKMQLERLPASFFQWRVVISPFAWNHQGGIIKSTLELSSNPINIFVFSKTLVKWFVAFKRNTAAWKPTLPTSSNNVVTKHHVLAWITWQTVPIKIVFLEHRILLGPANNLQGAKEWQRKDSHCASHILTNNEECHTLSSRIWPSKRVARKLL